MQSTEAVPQLTARPRAPTETEILLVRHGRSADVVPGSPESADPELHEIGWAQARSLALRLATKRIDAVYASHLARAVQTAQALAEPHGLTVETHEDLQEVLLGEWANGEFRRRAAAGDPEWVAWSRTRTWDGVPGGEGDAAVRARMRTAVDRLAQRHRGGTIAVVAHGGAINAYLADLLGIARTIWLSIENTSITVVRVDATGATVVTANDCHHLYDPVLASGS